MEKRLSEYGTYAIVAIDNLYKEFFNKLEIIEKDNSKILDFILFNNPLEGMFFKQILEVKYQGDFFDEFQESYCNIYKEILKKLLPMEGLTIDLNRDEFYNFILSLKDKPIFVIYPYERLALKLRDEATEQILAELEYYCQKLEEVEQEVSYFEQCMNNPTLYTLDSNRMFAKNLLNKKSVIAEIKEKSDVVIQKQQEIIKEISSREDYLEDNRMNNLEERTIIENILSRLRSHLFSIEEETLETEEDENIDKNELENYESAFSDNDKYFENSI